MHGLLTSAWIGVLGGLATVGAHTVEWSAPVSVGTVSWGVASGRLFSQIAAFGVRDGTVVTSDGSAYKNVSARTISEHMVECAKGMDDRGVCFHDFGALAPTDTLGGAATSFASSQQTYWTATGTELAVTQRKGNASFTGLPYPTHANHFTGNGLRLGGTAGVQLTSPTRYLQTAIVNWQHEPTDTIATSIVLFSSTDGLSFTYLSTVAVATENPGSDEGPNEHAMEVLADGSLLVVFRVDCGDGTHHPPGSWGRFSPYWQTRSHDGGLTWEKSTPAPGTPGCAYPHLLRLQSGPLLLSGGRSAFADTDDNDVWISWKGDGSAWERHALSAPHNALAPPGMLRYDAARVNTSNLTQRQTVAYTTLLSLPGDSAGALVGYDLIDHNGTHHGFVMRFRTKRS